MSTFFKKQMMDLKTGEVVQAVAFIPDAKDSDFLKVFPMFGEKVAKDLKMLNGESKLLLWLIAETLKLPYQSDLWIPISYANVSKELGITIISVKRYIKKLLELGYIEQFMRRQTVFRLKPDLFYKGNLKKYKIACYEEELRSN